MEGQRGKFQAYGNSVMGHHVELNKVFLATGQEFCADSSSFFAEFALSSMSVTSWRGR